MVIKFWRTHAGGQTLIGQISYAAGVLRVDPTVTFYAETLLRGADVTKSAAVEAALRRASQVFDGVYVRATVVNETAGDALAMTLKGGPGSGNFGHRGRPGLVGGSGPGGGGQPSIVPGDEPWPSTKGGRLDEPLTFTGISLPGHGNPPRVNVASETDSAVAQTLRQAVNAILADLPPNVAETVANIYLTPNPGYSFAAGGKTFTAGGEWDQRSSTVTLYQPPTKALTGYLRNELTHEIGHALHTQWMASAATEAGMFLNDHPKQFADTRRARDVRDPLSGYEGSAWSQGLVPAVVWAQPKNREEIRTRYPLLYLHQRFYDAWSNGAAGVTTYTAAWAKEGRWHEDVAEIASRYLRIPKSVPVKTRREIVRAELPADRAVGRSELVEAVIQAIPHLQRRIKSEKLRNAPPKD